ncbi:MAG TPA: precorrin-4 C(11)-methyltransferase [Pseudonocardiaceae bacterium]|nr:precorrin-4 C(11)-methyltransferase [Pseudonocardiaceae bacterium]
MTGRVSFVGAGPGAADLITLRGAKRIAEADIVVWAASLVDPECVREHARADAELVDSSLITHEDVLAIYRRAASDGLMVARVHSGDPALWGAVQEQYDSARKIGLDVEIVPGVSAFSAAAAVAGRELTVPEVAQSVILTRLEGGKTPMPDGEHIRDFARHGTTMAIFLSAARSGQLVEELRAGGYPDDTPVLIAYKVTWPDELVLSTTIGELEETVKQHKLWRHTLFLVGQSLNAGGTRSHLYNAGHFHTYRKPDPAARRALRARGAADTAPADGAEPADTGASTRSSGWSLHTSRSGWVAAKIVGSEWTATRRSLRAVSGDAETSTTGTEDSTEDGTSQGGTNAAWSAVRGWQETARSTSRSGARPRSGERRTSKSASKSVQADHPTLELHDETPPVGKPEPAIEAETPVTPPGTPPPALAKPAAAESADAKPQPPKPQAQPPQAGKSAAAKSGAARSTGQRSTKARSSTAKGAGKSGTAKGGARKSTGGRKPAGGSRARGDEPNER